MRKIIGLILKSKRRIIQEDIGSKQAEHIKIVNDYVEERIAAHAKRREEIDAQNAVKEKVKKEKIRKELETYYFDFVRDFILSQDPKTTRR